MHERPHKDTLAALGLTPQITLWVTTFREESVVLLQESMHFHDSWWIWYLRVALTLTHKKKKGPPWGGFLYRIPGGLQRNPAPSRGFRLSKWRQQPMHRQQHPEAPRAASGLRPLRVLGLACARGFFAGVGGSAFWVLLKGKPQETATSFFLGVV